MIIVTGASRGLGRAVCERLISRGVDVMGLARNVENISFPAMPCDVSSYEQVKEVAQEIKKSGSPVSGIVNAAGIASMNLAVTTPQHVTNKLITTNLLGTIYCCQVLAPLLIRRKGGTIINFSTIAVATALKGESIYVASKAGVEGFSRAFAREMADFNITVNCIAPGPVDTDLLKGVSSTQISALISQQIIKRQFTPNDVCDLVDALTDSKLKTITGQVFHVGGV